MALERDLEQQTITVSAVNMDATEFVLKLQLLKCGRVLEFKTEKAEGVCQLLIFVDEEGTKIQTTLFGQCVEKWTSILVPTNAYYIINGRIRPARLKCNNVNKVKELSVSQYSEKRECSSRFQTIGFSNGFVELNSIDSLDRKLFHDVLGVVVERSGVLVTGPLKRRVTTIADETNERVSVTLWNDFAEIDGLCLDNAENCKIIVAFCNVKVSEFKGTLSFASTAATCVILNPKLEKATQLEQWSRNMLETEVDISLVSSSNMRRAVEMQIPQILYPKNDNLAIVYCKFVATIEEVLRKDNICYKACNKCLRKVDILRCGINCDFCESYVDGWHYRYSFHLLLEFDNTNPEQVFKEDKFSTICETGDSKLEVNNSVEEDTEQSERRLSSNNEITNGDSGEGQEVKKQENSKLFELVRKQSLAQNQRKISSPTILVLIIPQRRLLLLNSAPIWCIHVNYRIFVRRAFITVYINIHRTRS